MQKTDTRLANFKASISRLMDSVKELDTIIDNTSIGLGQRDKKGPKHDDWYYVRKDKQYRVARRNHNQQATINHNEEIDLLQHEFRKILLPAEAAIWKDGKEVDIPTPDN